MFAREANGTADFSRKNFEHAWATMTYQMLPHPNLTEFPHFIKIKYYYHEGPWRVGLIFEKKASLNYLNWWAIVRWLDNQLSSPKAVLY